MIAVETEGVVTAIPGVTPPMRAKRYTSKNAVPLLFRVNAKQLGAAGFWYVALPDTPREAWDKLTGAAATTIQNAHEAIGADKGVLGVVEAVLGVPRWLVLALAVFAGWAALRAAGVVSSIKEV